MVTRALGGISTLLFFAAWCSSCFSEPNYEGLSCSAVEVCPVGFACSAEGTCHAGALRDGQPGASDPPLDPGAVSASPKAVPVQVDSISAGAGVLDGVSIVRAGFAFSLLELGDGTLLSFGYNAFGQLGHGTLDDAPVAGPVRLEDGSALGRIAQLEAGGDHVVVLQDDGMMWSWGRNEHGELGVAPSDSAIWPMKLGIR